MVVPAPLMRPRPSDSTPVAFWSWLALFTSGFALGLLLPPPWPILGVLLILDGVAEMIWFVQALLLPAYPAIKVPGLVVSLLAEVGLALWLLIKGVTSPTTAAPVPPVPGDARSDVPAGVGITRQGQR